MTITKAERIARLIKRNVDLWYANIITYERFGSRQSILWKLVAAYDVDEEVMEIIRPRFRVI